MKSETLPLKTIINNFDVLRQFLLNEVSEKKITTIVCK